MKSTTISESLPGNDMGHVFRIADWDHAQKYLEKVFGEVDLGVQEAVNQTIDEIGKEAAKRVRNASPKDRGKYAKGWRYRAVKMQPDGSFSAVVYNAKYGWLTHLVENGHPLRTKKGFKWIKGYPHISEVNKWVQTEGVAKLQDCIQKEINKIQ